MAVLAIVRAIVLILSMSAYILVYTVSRIIWPHTKESAFALRRHWISNVCLPILNVQVKVQGKLANKAALYVCNHRSFLDPAVISKYLDAFVIAKAEIADYPIINKGAEVTGVIWVRRDSQDSRVATRKAYVDTLQAGHNVLVYPEGTVSVAPESLDFKKGTFHEAAKNGFTVVPVAIEYRDKKDLWTIASLLKYYIQQCSSWSTHVKLHFGEPMTSTDGAELHSTAYQWINTEMKSMQSNWSRAWDKL